MKRNTVTLVAGIAFFVVFAMLLFIFQVRTTEIAVVTTFGRPTSQILDSGPHFKLPWPIQKVHKLDSRMQSFEDTFDEFPTADNNQILVQNYIGWRITDPTLFFPKFASGSIPEAEKVLEHLVRSAKQQVIGKHTFSQFVSTDQKQIQFEQIEQEIMKNVQDQLKGNNYGMEVKFLGIKRLGLPESVTQSVFDRMKQERQVLISEIIGNGTAEANRIRSDAEQKSAKMINQADFDALTLRAQGEAEAFKASQVFQEEPALAKVVLGNSALEKTLNKNTTLFLDENTLPLDALKGVTPKK